MVGKEQDEPDEQVIEATLTPDGDQTIFVVEERGMPVWPTGGQAREDRRTGPAIRRSMSRNSPPDVGGAGRSARGLATGAHGGAVPRLSSLDN